MSLDERWLVSLHKSGVKSMDGAGESVLSILGKAGAIVYLGVFIIVMVFAQAPVLGAMLSFILFLVTPVMSAYYLTDSLVFLLFEAVALALVCRRLTGSARLISVIVLVSLWQYYGWYCAKEYIGGY